LTIPTAELAAAAEAKKKKQSKSRKGGKSAASAALKSNGSAAGVVEPVHKPELELSQDLGKLLEDTGLADVTFAVDGQRFPAHRCVLVVRSAYFSGMFKSGQGMLEGGGRAAGKDIVLEEVRAGAFRVLLKYLYSGELPEDECCGEGLQAGEMVQVADRFQAAGLYEHCVEQFRGGLKVGNVVERLVAAHDSGLGVLEEAAMTYFQENARAFQAYFVRVVPCCFCLLRF
jgi:hypothetical protein